VSETDRVAREEAVSSLSDDDRAWLKERLREYDQLLEYLHDH
jgi:hypothetical protein